MSLINHGSKAQSSSSDQIQFVAGFEMLAVPQLLTTGKANFAAAFNMTAVPALSATAEADFIIEFGMTAVPRLNDEPNVLAEALFEAEFGMTAVPASSFLEFANFSAAFNMIASPVVKRSSVTTLKLSVTLLPDVPVTKRQKLRFQFLADGVPVPIKSAVIDEPAGSTGKRFEAVLSRVSDKAVIKAAELLQFQGKINDSEWQTLFESSKISQTSESIALGSNQPADEVSFGSLGDLNDKLSKSPEQSFTLYDPLRVDPPKPPDEIIVDTAGNAYAEQVFPVQNLDLYTLFEEMLVERCGFDEVKTNLPNYAIRSVRAETTSTIYDAVKPFIGQFRALVFEVDGDVWILDATASLPAGFPAPRELHISRYKQLSLNEQMTQLDGMLVSYSENDAFDFYTVRVMPPEIDEDPADDIFSDNYVKTTTVRTFYDYRNNNNPLVVMKTELVKEVTTRTGTFGDILGRNKLERKFDNFGREKKTIKTIENRVPQLPDETALSLQIVKTETVTNTFATHPINPKKYYISKVVTDVTGLIAIDEENKYLDQNFEQDFVRAHEAGNLKTGMTMRTGGISKQTEKFLPLPDGMVQVTKSFDDLVRKISKDHSEIRVGDIGLNLQTTRQRQIIVLPSNQSSRTGKPLASMSMAELPSEIFIPLARRELNALQTGAGGEVSVDLDGLELGIRKGSVFNMIGRAEESRGILIVEGKRETFDALGTTAQNVTTSLQGVKIA